MLPVQRKSVEPMAAHLSPDRVRSEHQRLHGFVRMGDIAKLAQIV
jgi:hypothetical protein